MNRKIQKAKKTKQRLTPHDSQSGLQSRKWRIGFTLLFLAIFMLRISDVVLNPQFWAEDGTIFFRENLCGGPAAIGDAYAGYYHLIPRLIALVASWFPALFAPAIYLCAALALTALVLYVVQSPRLALPLTPLLALAVVLPPDSLETYGNLANIQWFLALAVVAIVLSRPAPSRVTTSLEIAFVALAGLTGPFVMLLLPLFAARLLLDWKSPPARNRASSLTAAAAIAASAQIYALVHNPVTTGISPNFPKNGIADVPLIAAAAFFNHTFGPLLSSLSLRTMAWAGVLEIAVFLTLILISLRSVQLRFERLSLLYFGSVVLLASLYKFKDTLLALVPLNNGPRYFLLPTIVASWLMISVWREPKIGVLARMVLTLLLISTLAGFERAPLLDQHWAYWAKKLEAGDKPRIPINPKSWFVETDCTVPQ